MMFGLTPQPARPGQAIPADQVRSILARRHPEHREFEQIWRWLLDSLEGGERYRNATYPAGGGNYVHNLIRHEREVPRAKRGNELPQGYADRASTALLNAGVAPLTGAPTPTGFALGEYLDAAAESTFDIRRARTPVPTFVPEIVDKYRSRIYAREIKRDYGDPVEPGQSQGTTPGASTVGPPATPPGPPAPGSAPRPGPGGRPALAPAAPPAPPILTFPVAVPSQPASTEPKDQFGQALDEFWLDVDGAGTTMDDFMADTIAPLLITLGCLDVFVVDRPAPVGIAIDSAADYYQHDLDQPVAGYILPDNMVWWQLDPTETFYLECLTREWHDTPDGLTVERFRHWLPDGSTIYDGSGQLLSGPFPHGGGQVPILRLFDRKKYRTRNVGQSRMEPVAQIQRDYYNRDSELILSDILQANPPLQGHSSFLTGNTEITVGPGWTLPVFSDDRGAEVRWSYVTLDKSGDESIRQNLDRRRDEADRVTCMTKPAGVAAGGSGTVSQSGVSKQLDQEDGNNLLGKISRALAKAEDRIATLYLRVRFGRGPTPILINRKITDRIKIVYPQRFNLYGSAESLDLVAGFQRILAGAGTLPPVDGPMLQMVLRQIMVGFDDDQMIPMNDAIDQHVAAQAAYRQELRAQLNEPAGASDPTGDDDSAQSLQSYRASLA